MNTQATENTLIAQDADRARIIDFARVFEFQLHQTILALKEIASAETDPATAADIASKALLGIGYNPGAAMDAFMKTLQCMRDQHAEVCSGTLSPALEDQKLESIKEGLNELGDVCQSFNMTVLRAPVAAHRMYGTFIKRDDINDGAEYLHSALWHNCTSLGEGERMVKGWFVTEDMTVRGHARGPGAIELFRKPEES